MRHNYFAKPVPRLLLSLVSLLAASLVRAETKICVEVQGAESERPALRKLVLDELAHHPSHREVEQGCDSKLSVDMFELSGIQYLTVRINQEVPLRFTIKGPEDLNEKISFAIAQVLNHDPVYLSEDITHYSSVQRAAHSILKRGHNWWRLNLFQVVANTGHNAALATGAAAELTRGADNWLVFARVYFAGQPGGIAGNDKQLRIYTGGDAGLTYEFSALGNTTFYLSAGAGLQLLRFEGTVQSDIDDVTKWGFALSIRAGVRFLRFHDFDFDCFVAGYLPAFKTMDPDSQLMGQNGVYTPSAIIGVGVGF